MHVLTEPVLAVTATDELTGKGNLKHFVVFFIENQSFILFLSLHYLYSFSREILNLILFFKACDFVVLLLLNYFQYSQNTLCILTLINKMAKRRYNI